MQRYSQKAESNKRPPVIDLSSDEDSDTQSQKQNSYAYSRNAVNTNSNKSIPVLQLSHLQPNHMRSNLTMESQLKPINQMQFSTLSLDQNSILQNENLLKSHSNDKSMIINENEQLKRLNWQLQRQILQLKQMVQSDRKEQQQSQQKLQQFQLQIEQVKSKNRRLQANLLKLQKQFENKLINQQLPNRKNVSEQLNKIYAEVMDKIKGVIQKYLTELAKQKMNPKVEGIITDFVNEIVQINPRTNNANSVNTLNEFSSIKGNGSHNEYRSQRANKFMSEPSQPKAIGQQYRLLEKSIDKLKNMEKEIDQKTGSFLKKQFVEGRSINKSEAGLDQSSISVLDRSKSRRKRIFQ